MKKYCYIITILSLCFSLSAKAQLSRKATKQINAQIESSYALNEFDKVIISTKKLTSSERSLNNKIFECWINSAYELHDLKEAITCYEYYNAFIKETRNNKKISKRSLNRIESLSLITPLFRKGIQDYQADRNHSGTIEKFKEINAIDALFWQPHYYLAQLYITLNKFDLIIEQSQIALKWNPKIYELNYILAYSLFEVKEYEASIINIDKFLKVDNSSEDAHELKAHAFYNLNQYQAGIESINQAIQINPNQIEYYNLKFFCELKIESSEDCFATLIEILNLDTTNSRYIRTAYDFINRVDNRPLYLAILDSAISVSPNNLNLKLLSITQLKPQDKTNYKKNVSIFNDIIKLDSNNAYYHFLKGEFLFNAFNQKSNRTEESYFHLLRAYTLDPFNYQTYNYICRLHMFGDSKITKKFKILAIKNMQIKIKNDKNNPNAYFELAEAYNLPINGYGSGNKYKDSVLKYYDLSLLKGADSLTVMEQRGYILSSLKMYEKCIENYQWLLKQPISNTFRKLAHSYIASSYKSLKKYTKERDAILIAIDKFPDDKSLKKRLKEINRRIESENKM